MLSNIIEKCREKGISLAELERMAGLKNRTIYKWDENEPSVGKVIAVADILGTTVAELVKKEGEKNNRVKD